MKNYAIEEKDWESQFKDFINELEKLIDKNNNVQRE